MKKKKKILVVDDDVKVLALLYDLLKSHKYEVIATSEAKDAVELAKDRAPDLIIVDIIMPGCDGITLASSLSEHPLTRNIPVIFLTALASKEEVHRAAAVQSNRVIAKTCDLKDILAVVDETFSG